MDGRLVRVRDLTAKPVPASSSRPGPRGDLGGSVGPVISVLVLAAMGRRVPPIGAAEAACHSDSNPILFKKDCPGKPRNRVQAAVCLQIYGQPAASRQAPVPEFPTMAPGAGIPRARNPDAGPLPPRKTKTPGGDRRALLAALPKGDGGGIRQQAAWSPSRQRPSRGRRSAPKLPRPVSRPYPKSCGFRRRPWNNSSSSGRSGA